MCLVPKWKRAHLYSNKTFGVCAKKMCEKSLRNFKNSLHSCTKNREKKQISKNEKNTGRNKVTFRDF